VSVSRQDPGRIPPWEGRAAREALRWVKATGRAADPQSPCVICEQPIDYDLVYPDPAACSVQHIRSRRDFPHLTWVRSNWGPAHALCNSSAGAGDSGPIDLGVMTLD